MTDCPISQIVAERKAALTYRESPIPALRFANGANLSVQASSAHYCTPRDNVGPWASFECGRADHRQFPELRPYRVAGLGTDGVHPFVPARVIRAILKRCGGLAR
jgi:hypothetical protein